MNRPPKYFRKSLLSKSALLIALVLTSGTALSINCAASAQTTQSFDYDALGRLTDVRTAAPSGPVRTTQYQYDAAGNRSKLQTTSTGPTTGPNSWPARPVVVVPLNGLTVIQIAPNSRNNTSMTSSSIDQQHSHEID